MKAGLHRVRHALRVGFQHVVQKGLLLESRCKEDAEDAWGHTSLPSELNHEITNNPGLFHGSASVAWIAAAAPHPLPLPWVQETPVLWNIWLSHHESLLRCTVTILIIF